MIKQIYVGLFLALSTSLSCFSNEEISISESTLPEQEQSIEQKEEALEPVVPNIESVSPEELKIFVGKVFEELKTSLGSLVKQIYSSLRENENLRVEAIAFKTSFDNLSALSSQISPFCSDNLETLQNPETWMSIKELVEQLGQTEKNEFEACVSKTFKLLELMLVKSKTMTDFLHRLSEFDFVYRAFLEKKSAESKYAKFENAFPSIRSNIEELVEWRKSLDDKSAESLEIFFKKSLQIRKNICAWFKLIKKGIYKHIHLPVHDSKGSLPRIQEFVNFSKELSQEMEILSKKWTEGEPKA